MKARPGADLELELVCQLCSWRSGLHMPRTAGILLHVHALRDHQADE